MAGHRPQPAAPAAAAIYQPSLIERITPVHMGMLLVAAVILLAITATPERTTRRSVALPAIAGGGGVNADANGAAAQAAAAAGEVRVGSATVPAKVRSGGIPSPAAADRLTIAGGGGPAAAPGNIRGATIPNTAAERDSLAADQAHGEHVHGGGGPTPDDEIITAPPITPGQAVAMAENLAAQSAADAASSTPAAGDGVIVPL